MTDIDQALGAVYYDAAHPASYGSVSSLYKAVKPEIPALTLATVRRFLQRQDVYSLHGRLRKRFKRRKTLAKGLNYQLQMDLVDLNSIRGYNNNSRYLLTAIDVFSRKAYVQPLRSKHHKAVLKALERLFQDCPYPKYIQTDQGLEFLSGPVKFAFEVGDTVRISKLNRQFRKGYLPTYNEEYFVIQDRLATSPPTYKLVDHSGEVLVGVFYREELQRVIPTDGQYTILKRRKRKGSKESLVHYTGRPSNQDEWIPDRLLKKA